MTTETKHKPLESHDTHSKRLIRHAEEQLAKGDRLQASEKAWGAVAHRVKAIARQRGWKYEYHSDYNDLKPRIAKLTDDPKLTGLLLEKANFLHSNYYRDEKTLEHLREDLDEIKELLDILDGPQFRPPARPKHRKALPRRSGSGSEIGGMGHPIGAPKKHQAGRARSPDNKPPRQKSLDKGKR